MADEACALALSRLPIEIRVRVRWGKNADSPGLCWTGWKLSAGVDGAVGQIIACLEPDERYPSQRTSLKLNRYWAVSTGRLLWPSVVEYRPGDKFDISQAPYRDEIEQLMGWSDADLVMYFRLHADALVSRIASAVR